MKVERQEHRLTVVNGTTVRSALEARWATFFDCLRLRWRYEPETFTAGNGARYTPDFHVKGMGWVEIKPTLAHFRESWDRLKGCLVVMGEPLWAFCSARVELRKGESVLFKDGKILLPDECHLYAAIAVARNKALGFDATSAQISAAIALAIEAANDVKLDHMVRVGDRMRYDFDRIQHAPEKRKAVNQ